MHGQDAREDRDQMMEEIILSLRAEREEFDMDVLYDYTFVAGDMNYRFDSTYEDMMSTN